jgi:hypothetical protein
MIELREGQDEHPPQLSEEPPPSRGKSIDRDSRCAPVLLFGCVSGQGRLLNRGLSLLSFYYSMGH